MKLSNETLADIVTIEIEHMHDGNAWESGKHDVSAPESRPIIVTRGRTYSLKLTNARGDSWSGVAYSIGSGLTHDKRGREVHPTAEAVLHSLTLDASCSEDYPTFEDFAENLGYDSDSRKALDAYLECGKTYNNIMRLFNAAERERISEATEDM